MHLRVLYTRVVRHVDIEAHLGQLKSQRLNIRIKGVGPAHGIATHSVLHNDCGLGNVNGAVRGASNVEHSQSVAIVCLNLHSFPGHVPRLELKCIVWISIEFILTLC